MSKPKVINNEELEFKAMEFLASKPDADPLFIYMMAFREGVNHALELVKASMAKAAEEVKEGEGDLDV